MTGESQRVQGYLETVARIERDISMIDRDAALTSIAISLRRIADVMESSDLANTIHNAITSGLYDARPR